MLSLASFKLPDADSGNDWLLIMVMKTQISVLVVALVSVVCLVGQEAAPKRKTPPPPIETIVEGALIWSREGAAIVKIPRQTIRATLESSALVIKSGSTNTPIQIV